jgi:hypothetical protein
MGGLAAALGPIGGPLGLGAAIGGPVLASMFAPEGQELSSFEGIEGAPEIDPVNVMRQLSGILGGYGDALTDKLARGPSLPSSYVQDVPTFTGGGLPMPIGVTGRDPALSDRSLLSRPGPDLSGLFALPPSIDRPRPGPAGGTPPESGSTTPGPGDPGNRGGTPGPGRGVPRVPTPTPGSPSGTTPAPGRGDGATPGPGDPGNRGGTPGPGRGALTSSPTSVARRPLTEPTSAPMADFDPTDVANPMFQRYQSPGMAAAQLLKEAIGG